MNVIVSENLLQNIALYKLLLLSVYAYLYGRGGMTGGGGKWQRRYLAPALLVGGICLFSYWVGNFSWWYLTYYPLLCGASTLGYGGKIRTIQKVRKRLITGVSFGLSPIALVIINQAWVLFGLHIFICCLMSVVLGVKNPTSSPRYEETLLGATFGLIPLFLGG